VECCLFAAGCAGSQAPRTEAVGGSPADDFARARAYGDLVATRVEAAIRAATGAPEPIDVDLCTVEIPLPPPAVRLTPDLALAPLIASTQLSARAPLSLLRVGDDGFLGFPCEITGEVALAMEAEVARASRGARLHVLSFSGDWHGYVPRDEYWAQDRYENQLSLHGPRFAEYLEALARAAFAPP
jgi:hypothetical protein